MGRLALLLRWSWRDLRSHWAKVVAIALVIAIGTGGYAGLTSTAGVSTAASSVVVVDSRSCRAISKRFSLRVVVLGNSSVTMS